MMDCAMIELSDEIIRQTFMIKDRERVTVEPNDLKKAAVELRDCWNIYKLECEKIKRIPQQGVLDDILTITACIMKFPNYPFESDEN